MSARWSLLGLTAFLLTAHPAGAARRAPGRSAGIVAAAKALRKLEMATTVGVSYVEYNHRLIDTASEVTEDLRPVPNGPQKARALEALRAYYDAAVLWRECVQYTYKSVLKVDPTNMLLLHRYGLSLSDKTGNDEIGNDKDLWLGSIWATASRKLRGL